MTEKTIVWDPLVRVLHWSLVTGLTIAWLTEDGPGFLHDGAGYVVLGVIATRVVWGLIGTRYARFFSFIPTPSDTISYAKSIVHGTEPRYLGHNPLGGWMIVALLSCAGAAGLSGWLYTTDTFWGIEWMEDLHEAFANLLLFLVACHVAGVIFTSFRGHENLVRSMINGWKEKRPGDR